MKKFTKTLEEVITFTNYFDKLKLCNRSVDYKFSVQEYDVNCVFKITDTIDLIRDGRIPRVKDIRMVAIFERGKLRTIYPIDIADRITQKVLCDEVLIPAIQPSLIYHNGASVKGKGTIFSRRSAEQFLETAKKRYGEDNVYALTFDFKNYFGSIPHRACYELLDKYIEDKRLVNLCIGIIESYSYSEIMAIEDEEERNAQLKKLYNHELCGICLGSQISQVLAVAIPNQFDHYIKDVLGMEFYVRHMDDGIIFYNDKKRLQAILPELKRVAAQSGLTLHPTKTKIVSLKKGVTFLKVKYHFHNGKTVKRLVHSGIVRERRKLKKFEAMVFSGRMTLDDVYANMQSWNAHSKIAKCYHTTKSMFALYDKLYGGYKLTRKYYRNHRDIKRRKKVTRL